MDTNGEKLTRFTRMMKHDALRIPDRLNGVASAIVDARKMDERRLMQSDLRAISLIVHCLIEDIDNEALPVRSDFGTRAENDTLRLVLERADRWLMNIAKYLEGVYQIERATQARTLAFILRMSRDVLLDNPDRPITPVPEATDAEDKTGLPLPR